MNLPVTLHNPLQVMGGAAAVGALAVLIASLPPRSSVEPSSASATRQLEAPDADRLNERIPDPGAVLGKHLFVPTREATGQNSFPDLVVKGVFIGQEKSAIFSLKSRPGVNLRVWQGEVETTLNSVTDPRDPRQPLVTFLREWPIKEIRHESVTVEHFITGEAETYEVDYVAVKKVKDDAARGYGQGVMPQGGAGSAAARTAQKKSPANPRPSAARQREGAIRGAQFMADRVSGVLNRMNPQQQQQFMKYLQQQTGQGNGGQSNPKNTDKKPSKKSSKKKSQR